MTALSIDRKEVAKQSVYATLTVGGMVLVPFLIHLIPFSGKSPLGAYLLPMFIAPLVAAFYLSAIGLVAASIAAPLINHMVTGMPTVQVLPLLIIELAIFSLFLSWLVRKNNFFIGMSALAYLIAKVASLGFGIFLNGNSVSPVIFDNFISALWVALPGMLILLILERILIFRTRAHEKS